MKSAAMSGGRWSIIEAILVQLAAITTTFVLARILAQEDFGIVAIVAVATGLLTILTQVGLSVTLIQRKELEPGELSTIFWAASFLGILTAGLGALVAAPVAAAFQTPDATPFLTVAPLALLFGLTASVPRAILLRELRFRAVSLILIATAVMYAVTAITLAAVFDLGVWSIIVAQVVRRFFLLVVTLATTRWRPRFVFHYAVLKRDLGFTANYFAGVLGMYVVKNADYWVVRRVADEAALGTYYIAYVLPTILRQRISWVIDRIMLPVLSRIKDDRSRFAAAYLDVVRLLALVSFPILVGLSLVTHVLVPVAFGPGWEEAVTPMMILSLAAAVEMLWQLASTLLVTDGTPGRTVVVVALRLAVLAVALIIAAQFGGLEAVALAVLVGSAVAAVAGQAMVVRRLDLRVRTLVQALLPALLPTAAMVGGVLGGRALLIDSGVADLAELVALVAVGLVTYLAFGFAVHRPAFASAVADARRLVSGS